MDLTNECNCGCDDCQENNTPTNLVKTVNGSRRQIIYYDPELFCNKKLLSVSLLIGNDEIPFQYHYNSTHDEDLGIDGMDWKPIDDIVITLYPRPKTISILGDSRMNSDDTLYYEIATTYDINNNFTYDWELIGSGFFVDTNTQLYTNGGKKVQITFNGTKNTTLKLLIKNPCGCERLIEKTLYPGGLKQNILIVRNSYK